MTQLISKKGNAGLKGEVFCAPDKSVSHRALMLSSLAHGVTKISNLLESDDVLRTAEALRKLGVVIKKHEAVYEVTGSGISGLIESDDVIDMGNSGTATRLLAGLVAPYNFTTFFTGDSSLRKRPMARVFEPIKLMGASIVSRSNLMPFAVIGAKDPMPITYEMKIASAQVKSCVLLAGCAINGITTVIEPEVSRDHTEIMMKYLGLPIKIEEEQNGSSLIRKISYKGMTEFDAKDLTVPGDISSAAFLIVAALITPNSSIKIKNVGINPMRFGIIETLLEMGGSIEIANKREVCGELVADIIASTSNLKGIDVPRHRAPKMIDEYPILSVAAAFADGVTKMNGIEELRHKESDRISAVATGITSLGVSVKVGNDFMEIQGGTFDRTKSAFIKTMMDHRIAMSFLIMGLASEGGVTVDDSSMIQTSFPTFFSSFKEIGAEFSLS